MANRLGKNIKEGEVVILDPKAYRGSEEEREFICKDGFGMMTFTSGTAIMGEFVSSGEKARVEGYEILKVKD